MNKLVNTLVTLGAISLSTLPAQAVNEQLTAGQKAQSQSAREQIKEATTANLCFNIPCFPTPVCF